MAEKYFTDMNNDVQITDKRYTQRSADGYNQLPKIFTKDDVMRCFGYDKPDACKKKLYRLAKTKHIELINEGENKGCYRKLIQNYV